MLLEWNVFELFYTRIDFLKSQIGKLHCGAFLQKKQQLDSSYKDIQINWGTSNRSSYVVFMPSVRNGNVNNHESERDDTITQGVQNVDWEYTDFHYNKLIYAHKKLLLT